jgi:hypothetical protein
MKTQVFHGGNFITIKKKNVLSKQGNSSKIGQFAKCGQSLLPARPAAISPKGGANNNG